MALSADEKADAIDEFWRTGGISCPTCGADPQSPTFDWKGKQGYSILLNCRNGHVLFLLSSEDRLAPQFTPFTDDEKNGIEATWRRAGQADCPHCQVPLESYNTQGGGGVNLYCPRCSSDIMRP